MQRRITVLLMTSKCWVGFNLAPPIGLYRLKNYLEKNELKCDILDFDIDSEQSYLQRVSEGDYDVIGMSVTHLNMKDDLDTLLRFRDAARRSAKKCIFIAGGHEATLNYKQWLESGMVDIIFLGFAEDALSAFCVKLSFNETNGNHLEIAHEIAGVVFYKSDGKLVYKSSPRLTSEKFRQLSFNNIKSAIPYDKYWQKVRDDKIDGFNHTEFIVETVRLYTSSHCPRKCGFCSSQSFLPESQKSVAPILMLSAEDVYELVLYHIDKYGARGFLFSDDDFPVGNREGIVRILNFSKLIVNAKNSGRIPKEVKFFCQSRIADFLDQKNVRWNVIEAMKNAGFDNTGLGIETFSDKLLKSPFINKIGVTTNDYRIVLDALLEKGIIPIIFLIVGIPDGTVEEQIETMYVAMEYIRKGADVSVLARLRANPGSPVYSLGGYDISTTTWKNPYTGTEIVINDYFIPKNEELSRIVGMIQETTESVINNIKIQRGRDKNIVPKSLVGIATFIATAKLLHRDAAANDFTRTINDILDEKTH